ncbi:glycoside hydrolase family 78 protein [Nonomuraea sp. NPDC050404]|uniref:glycoside hydrolase family 78 protein n=1 Tax=Nonomuraea sp. NPDC050404 TaxID=3155783 RepID=UPI0033E6A2D9
MTRAQFISGPAPSDGGPAVYFRKDLTVAAGLRRATLRSTALGIVVPYVNGTRVGDDVLAPTWTSYRHRINVARHDVTGLLTTGDNTLGAVVGEGWAVGPLSWELTRHHYSDRPALYAELELEYADRTEVIGTDETFRAGDGPVRENGVYAGETYDARRESPWARPGFDDSTWAAARPHDWDLATLRDDAAPPIRRIEELSPREIRRLAGGRVIVDFGQIISGWVRLTVAGQAGTTITLRHAELLTPDGELEAETLRKATATDRYTLRGSTAQAPETWEPQFTFHGFRYVEIDGWPGIPEADNLRAIVVHTDMTRTGWFATSHDLVNRLHENTVWGMRGNFVGVPTDCPQRDERLGWTGDLNAFAPTAAYLYDVRAVLGSWLTDLAAEQAATGSVPWTMPDILAEPKNLPTALWSDVAVSLPWLLYEEYGEVEILRRAYPSMTAFMRQVEGLLDEDGLWSSGFQYGDWLDPDAPADNPAGGKTDAHLVASAYLCKTTRELAATAGVLGRNADAEHFRALHERVRQAFRDEYVTPKGRVTNESATAYALAICFGILDDDQLPTAGRRLATLIADAGHTIRTGFAGTPLVTDALTATGHLDTAYRLLLQTKCPSFLYPVTMGATTIWERWDSVLPDGTVNKTGMTSLNHYALGAVADWLHRVVGGLQRLEPGWRRIRVAPRPGGDLTWAQAIHDTVLGRAAVHWRVEDGTVHLDVTVPEGATAIVELPLHPDARTEEAGPGTHTWSYPAPADYGTSMQLSLQSPLRDIAADDAVWQGVRGILLAVYPDVPIDAGLQHAGDAPLEALLARLPGSGETLRAQLQAALGTGTRP